MLRAVQNTQMRSSFLTRTHMSPGLVSPGPHRGPTLEPGHLEEVAREREGVSLLRLLPP